MSPLATRVESLLRERFKPPAHVELREHDGIVGSVTSTEFRDLELIDRLSLIWAALDAGLRPDEQRKISIIVPQAPEEVPNDEDD